MLILSDSLTRPTDTDLGVGDEDELFGATFKEENALVDDIAEAPSLISTRQGADDIEGPTEPDIGLPGTTPVGEIVVPSPSMGDVIAFASFVIFAFILLK